MIACILIPDFVMSVEAEQSHVPVLLMSPAGKVQAASFEAMQQGVRIGMRLQQAQAFCPEAMIRSFDPVPHTQAIDTITKVLAGFTNRIEVAPGFWDTFNKNHSRKKVHPSAAVIYLDLGKLNNPHELTMMANQVHTKLWDHLRMRTHIGLASSKFTASVAARFAHTHHPKLIKQGQEATFLAALPITLLPLEAEAQQRLRRLGIDTLGQLAELPPGALLAQFGTAGRLMYQLAHGQDERPVSLLLPQPIEHLMLHLHSSVEDRLMLETILQEIGCDLEQRLAKRSYTLRNLELIVHMDDGSSQRTHTTLRKPTADGGQIGRSLIRLFTPLKLSAGVVTVEVIGGDLQPVVWRQLDLFGQEFTAQDKLRQLLDNLTLRFGSEVFYQIVITNPAHRVPEKRFEIHPVEAA